METPVVAPQDGTVASIEVAVGDHVEAGALLATIELEARRINLWSYVGETMANLLHQTAFLNLTWGNFVMIAVACLFLLSGNQDKRYEPLLLVPIAFGMLAGKYLSGYHCKPGRGKLTA